MRLRRFLLGTFVLAACCRISHEQNNARTDEENSTESIIPAEMKITSWNDMPFSGLVQKNGTWVGKGYAFYLLNLLSDKLNFTYTIVPPEQHVLSSRKGIMNLLYEQKVDMAVAFLPMLPELQKYCTFSIALDESELTALMKRPDYSTTGTGLLAPFEQTVWLLVLTAVISVGPIIFIFAKLRSRLWHDPNSERYTLPSCMWFVYGSLLKQGTSMVATTDSTRLLFATWWIFILILTSFYTANLTAFLTKPQFTLPIKSLHDIAHKNYHWVAYKGRTLNLLLSQYYSTGVDALHAKKFNGRYISTYDYPIKNILNAVNKNKLFIGETHYLQSLIFEDYVNRTREHVEHQKRCRYVIMPGTIFVTARAFAFPQNSSLVQLFNKELMALVEAGIMKREKLKNLPAAQICPLDIPSNERQLRLSDLSLTFIVVLVGYAVATVVFVLEIAIRLMANIWKRRKQRTIRWNSARRLCCKWRSRSKKSSRVNLKHVEVINRLLDKRENPQKTSPLYQKVPYDFAQRKKYSINGRDYYVVLDRYGGQRLIPIRTPSAFLFQYTT